MRRTIINVKGIVQGVGFRPFIYRSAIKNSLKGFVYNNLSGLYIDIEGKESDINEFLYNLKYNHPHLAKINNITTRDKKPMYYKDFQIRESKSIDQEVTLISPDIVTCNVISA
ncbi:acylphosphatase [Clostridium cylindrosporum]|nr:acylphosphatase [Clostridium cylindrosporum]